MVRGHAHYDDVADPRTLRMRDMRAQASGAVGRPAGAVRGAMLSYYLHDGSSALRFKLCGALTAGDVTELEQCRLTAWSTIGDRNFLVDVSDLTSVDEAGRALLEAWYQDGTQFIAKSAESRLFVESIMGHRFSVVSAEAERAPGRLPWRIAALTLAVAGSLLLPATV